MKKSLLAIVIASTVSFGASAANMVAAATTLASNEQVQSLAKEVFAENWEDVAGMLAKAAKEEEEKKTLPEEATFRKDKTKAQENIEKMYARIFKTITDGDIEHFRGRIESIEANKKTLNNELSELQAQIGVVFEEADVNRLMSQIEEKERQLEVQEAKRLEVIDDIHLRLERYGISLEFEQVESMLMRVNADDIIAQTTIFPILAEFAKHLGNTAKVTAGNLEASKRYYSYYTQVLAFQMFIIDQYENRMQYQYIPKLNRIKDESEKLVFETKKLSRTAPKEMRPVYAQNVKSQLLTLKVIDLYSKQLNSDLKKIKAAHKMVGERHKVAMNTLATVSMSFDVSMLIKANEGMFDKVMELSMPDMLSFDNVAMEEEFNKLTAKLAEK